MYSEQAFLSYLTIFFNFSKLQKHILITEKFVIFFLLTQYIKVIVAFQKEILFLVTWKNAAVL